jgi:hypothetical protein
MKIQEILTAGNVGLFFEDDHCEIVWKVVKYNGKLTLITNGTTWEDKYEEYPIDDIYMEYWLSSINFKKLK